MEGQIERLTDKDIGGQKAPANPVPWQRGHVDTPVGPVPRVDTKLNLEDTLGMWRVRLGLGRMAYQVPPGLYAVGEPDHSSPVLVSANYKLSFDLLRRELSGQNLWILVIDTKGINVWCAAGKGTFGTEELLLRLAQTGLQEIVSHRQLILPQLGAPGVAAHQVFQLSGFRVKYGPVRARDIPAFLEAGYRAAPEMRRVTFGLWERLEVVPVEAIGLSKVILGLVVTLFLLNSLVLLLNDASLPLTTIFGRTMADLLPFLGAILVGTVLVPALLPYIPGRAFAWKGFLLGIFWTWAYLSYLAPQGGWLQAASYFLLLPAIASFLSLNFTGSSTYTSLSGVVKEMSIALPAAAVSAGVGTIVFIGSRFF